MYREVKLRKLKVSSLDLYLDKHSIGCSRSTLKQGKEDWDIVAAYITRSIVNNDTINNEQMVSNTKNQMKNTKMRCC